jgi:hypothetical protein
MEEMGVFMFPPLNGCTFRGMKVSTANAESSTKGIPSLLLFCKNFKLCGYKTTHSCDGSFQRMPFFHSRVLFLEINGWNNSKDKQMAFNDKS